MAFLFVIVIIYGIPISLGIVIIRQLFIKNNKANLARKFTKASFAILALTAIIIVIYDWTERFHYAQFQMNQEFTCYISIEEIDSFLDTPSNFNIKVKDSESNTILKHELEALQGSCLEFFVDVNHPNCLLVKGCDKNIHIHKLLSPSEHQNEISTSTFQKVAHLSHDYKIIMSN